MEQPKQLSQIIKAQTDTLPTASYDSSQSELCSVLAQRGALVTKRFGNDNAFLTKVTPDTQDYFARNVERAVMGDYPTLTDIDAAYGKGFSIEWLIPQIDNMSVHTGAKNLTEQQQLGLARILATECRHLKITEVLLFFHRFKAGRYGRFYGSVDPMVVTCALQEFISERNTLIDQYTQAERERKLYEELNNPDNMSREEWEEIKMLTRMYEMQINR